MDMIGVKRAMTIAGSDSGGGAGIQADLKTFAALGVYGTSVITAVTAQNTLKVTGIQELSTNIIASQIDAVMEDIGANAAKTGMLSSPDIIDVVACKIEAHSIPNLVVDPVMVAKSGDRLLREDAIQSLRDRLLPISTVVTPNIPEAEMLVGHSIESMDDIHKAAKEIASMGASNVVIKGGHLSGPAVDLLYYDGLTREFAQPRLETENTHGTGCTFASAIAAYLAQDRGVEQAVYHAKEYVTEAIKAAYPVGSGHGPVHHFYRLWDK